MIGDRRARLGGSDSTIADRIPLLAALIVLVFGAFLLRLFQLQFIQTDDLRRRSERNYVRTVRLEAPRGDILDREGRVLATTRPAFAVQVIPNDLRRPERTLRALASLIDQDPQTLRAELGSPRGRTRFQPVQVVADLTDDQRARVESHLYALAGVVTDVRPRRLYTEGQLAAHLLGTIGEIQRGQLETRRYADYRPGEVIGQSGVESLMQSELRGQAGGRNLVVNVAGRVEGMLDEIEPVSGGSVTLTLDLDMQRAAEQAFLPDVIGEPSKMGAVVALDVRTGDVLALVSKPSYDPNAFAGGIASETWKSLVDDEWRPLQNRAIAGNYPPGSTYKALVAAAGLEEGLVDPNKKVFCPGSFRLGRRTYRCWKKEGHGAVDLHRALVESCDVYFYHLGLELGIDRLAFFARGFGLGKGTGIPLANEQAGLVPTTTWKERRFKEPWMLGETVSASIGQGFNLVTPLQLAVAYGAIANGGKVLKPRLVLRVTDSEGKAVEAPPAEVLATVPVAPEHLALVRSALEGVVNEPRGTGGRSRVPGIRSAGKTGTAQVVGLEHTDHLDDEDVRMRHRDHAWFVGYAPAEAPEIVVAALVEHGGHGGSAAGPVVQKVMAAYFNVDLTPPAPAVVPHAPVPPQQEADAEEAPPEPELDAPGGGNPDEMPELDVPDPQGTEEMQRPEELPQPQTQARHGAGVSVAGAGGADARD
ncbi:MAG TPA: penicillin-binding protein 2 [Myxococcota bacterium]|nr:penicillin-binding protein 2 [Myxococcota bacterium]